MKGIKGESNKIYGINSRYYTYILNVQMKAFVKDIIHVLNVKKRNEIKK